MSWRTNNLIVSTRSIGLDSLVACLEETLARSPNEFVDMGLYGRAWIEAELYWAHIAEQMAKTYHLVLHGGVKPTWVKED